MKTTIAWKIWGVVATLHGISLILLMLTHDTPAKKMPRQKAVVHTVSLSRNQKELKSALAFLDEPIARPPEEPTQPIAAQTPASVPIETPPPTPDPSPLPSAKPISNPKKISTPSPSPKKTKTSTPKKTVSKKPTTQSPPSKKSTSSSKQVPTDQMLSMMKKSLEHIENASKNVGGTSKKSKGTSSGSNSSSFKGIESLGSEHLSMAEVIATYQEELVIYLKHLLELPEMGEVKLRLTLTKNGKVASLNILSCSSTKNRSYAETKIPTLSFPPFGERLKGESQHTFSVTLKGEG